MGRPAEELGRFIVLEGIDGAGTTTQAEAISLALRAEGRTVLTTREPSDRPVGALLRQALSGAAPLSGGKSFGPETLALLFAADRTDHLASEVIPALERGEVVICDRFTDGVSWSRVQARSRRSADTPCMTPRISARPRRRPISEPPGR